LAKRPKQPTAKSLANLIPLNRRSLDERRRISAIGAQASREKRLKRKELSEFYGDLLAREHEIKIGKRSGVVGVMVDILSQKIDHKAKVSLLKEIRETREGSGTSGSDASKKDIDLLGSLLGAPRSPNEQDEKSENTSEE